MVKRAKLTVVRMKLGFWLVPEFYNLAGQKGCYWLWWHFFRKKDLSADKNIVIDTMKQMLKNDKQQQN